MFLEVSTKRWANESEDGFSEALAAGDIVHVDRDTYGQMMGKNFDVVGGSIVISIDDERKATWELIKRERERRQKAGVRVGTNWFHSDPDSRTQQLGLVMTGANLPAGLQWKTLTGAFVTMTPSLALQLFQATTMHDVTMFGYAEQLKASMASMTLEQVVALDVREGWVGSGWPETFEE